MNANFLRPVFRASLLVAGLLPLATLHGQSLSSQLLDFRLGGGSTTLSFLPFNPSLGTLQSVTLDFGATERYVLGAFQTGGEGLNHYTFSVDGSGTIQIDSLASLSVPASGELTGFSAGVYDPATHGGLSASQLLVSIYFGEFVPGADPTIPAPGAKLAGQSALIEHSYSLPLDFGGSLPLTFLSGRTSVKTTGGNNVTLSMVDLFGTAKLTYSYVPIPEPATAAGFLGVAVALVVLRRRRGASAAA